MRSRHLSPFVLAPTVLGTPFVAGARLRCCSVHNLALMSLNGPIAGSVACQAALQKPVVIKNNRMMGISSDRKHGVHVENESAREKQHLGKL